MRRLAARVLARFVRLVLRRVSGPRPNRKERPLALVLRKAYAALVAYLGAAPSAVKGLVNAEELLRSLATAIGSGSLIGVALVVLTAVSSNIAAIVPNPVYASIASFLVVHLIDLLRRLQHDAPTPKAVVEFLSKPPGPVA